MLLQVLGAKLNSDYYGEDFQGDLFLAQYFVKIAEGPDGALYYCALVGNRVGRWELV